tara:strand:+ start:1096 stop:2052 length:957 start_codon:yes stop_codon:yes gene_type:complete
MLNKSYKEVLILGLNNDQIPYILIIKKLGYKIFGVDKNENAPGKKYCDYFKKTSYTNVKKIIKFLKNKKFSSNGFFFTASSQISLLSLAKIAKKLNIKFVSPKIIDKCIDKSKMNKLFKKNKISTAKTKYILNKKITVDKNREYFLKSDYGKSPKYCYLIKNGKIPALPAKDDFYKKYFLLQEKINGDHFRINFLKSKFYIFKKLNDKVCHPVIKINKNFKIIKKKIIKFVKTNNLNNFLIKFDLIINENNWYIIDIGFDPPKRLENVMIYKNKDFYKAYVYNWLGIKNLFYNFNLNDSVDLIIKISKNGKTQILKRR